MALSELELNTCKHAICKWILRNASNMRVNFQSPHKILQVGKILFSIEGCHNYQTGSIFILFSDETAYLAFIISEKY